MSVQEEINENTSISKLAVIVSQHLKANGIISVLSGGSVVTIYTDKNFYESNDLDFISPANHQKILEVMAQIGFVKAKSTHKHLTHPNTKIVVEFPTGPVNLGGAPIRYEHFDEHEIDGGKIRILSPTQSVMDRLLHYISTKDAQGLDQAREICERQMVNLSAIEKWSIKEAMASPEQHERIMKTCKEAIAKYNKSQKTNN
ncbi:nucleotidyltransferase family protein [Bdellovibrio bacteriovorus]|uniref:Nucleotidyltransferase family protein n=1 Tax=Bdellovibrio reynosensis TaxID=2835041 RepID=A0ABY4CC75_9BACT|nr:nucleotidyltransferase family protein [Bdellovibrio reynosensis]UOF01487.1 nucleotidyltransferase family protein [Bdellovibrio reynosensis]